MNIKTLLLTTALVLSPAVAFADAPAPVAKKANHTLNQTYLKAEIGLTSPSDVKENDDKLKFSKGFTGSIGGGYRVNEFFRTDLLFNLRKFDSKKIEQNNKSGKIKATTYSAMLNGYLDARNDTIFTPYVMAGIGVGKAKFVTPASLFDDNKKYKGSATGFMWNVGGGCQAKVYENVSLDLGYRYVNLPKIKLINKAPTTHDIVLGIAYDL